MENIRQYKKGIVYGNYGYAKIIDDRIVNKAKELCNEVLIAIPDDEIFEQLYKVEIDTENCMEQRKKRLEQRYPDVSIVSFGVHHYQFESLLEVQKEIDVIFIECSENNNDYLQYNIERLSLENIACVRISNDIEQEKNVFFALLDDLWKEEVYLRDAQKYLSNMMKEVDDICTENNIHYYLIYGSLLGAVRHKDIIPWDDDLDVAMPREDYERFRHIVEEKWGRVSTTNSDGGEVNRKYALQEARDLLPKVFYDFMSRLISYEGSVTSRLFDKVRENTRNIDIHNRMALDIYIIENASMNRKKHDLCMKMMKGIYVFCMAHRDYVDYSEYTSLKAWQIRILKMAIFLGKCIPLRWLEGAYSRLSCYARNENTDVCYISNRPIRYIEQCFSKEIFGNGIRQKFGEIEVLIPDQYDTLLQYEFGPDYMTPYPIRYRMPFHYIKAKGTWQ